MKVYKQITDIFVKIVSAALMVLVAGIVGIMLYELCLRNFFNKSFRSSTCLLYTSIYKPKKAPIHGISHRVRDFKGL